LPGRKGKGGSAGCGVVKQNDHKRSKKKGETWSLVAEKKKVQGEKRKKKLIADQRTAKKKKTQNGGEDFPGRKLKIITGSPKKETTRKRNKGLDQRRKLNKKGPELGSAGLPTPNGTKNSKKGQGADRTR